VVVPDGRLVHQEAPQPDRRPHQEHRARQAGGQPGDAHRQPTRLDLAAPQGAVPLNEIREIGTPVALPSRRASASPSAGVGVLSNRSWRTVRTIPSQTTEEVVPMKRLLIVLVLLVAAVIGLGFYQGWFHFSMSGTDGRTNATLTVDQEKIEADKEQAKKKVQELEQKVKEKTSGQGKDETPRP
jgi:hypothetical protein